MWQRVAPGLVVSDPLCACSQAVVAIGKYSKPTYKCFLDYVNFIACTLQFHVTQPAVLKIKEFKKT